MSLTTETVVTEMARPEGGKALLLVMDGLGGYRTVERGSELTEANTPNLDRLAGEGSLGLHDPVTRGITPGSGAGHLGLFGYDPLAYEIGRGALSAAGIVAAQQGDPLLGFIPRWYVIFQFPLFLVFLLAGIAETNRAPFDLPEAESELVGGYHTEYSGVKFALFFLAEYLNIVTVSAVATTAFLGGPDGPAPDFLPWLWPILWFMVKVFFFIFIFIWLRATLPRMRFDRLMDFGWKVLIPVALAWVAVTAVVLVVDINLPRPVLLGAIGVLLVLLLLSFLLPSSDKEKADRTAPGGSTP